jgi:hypothetical protein
MPPRRPRPRASEDARAVALTGESTHVRLDAFSVEEALAEALAKALRAVRQALTPLPPAELDRLAKRASAFELFRTLAASAADQELDQLARARLRGVDAKKKLLEASGGFLDGAAVAELLGLTPAAVHKRYKAHQLLALREERRRLLYPALQFDGNRVVQGLPLVLRALGEAHHDPWAQLRFLAGASTRLGGRAPIRALEAGDIDRVLEAAGTFGEHGAA